MKIVQFNARVDQSTIDQIDRLAVAMAEARGLPRKLSQADVVTMAVQALADKELPSPEKKQKKNPRSA